MPLVYALLSDKSSVTYYKLFDTVKHCMFKLGCMMNPRTVLSDFESGLIEVIRMQFPNAVHAGCYFHFRQAL